MSKKRKKSGNRRIQKNCDEAQGTNKREEKGKKRDKSIFCFCFFYTFFRCGHVLTVNPSSASRAQLPATSSIHLQSSQRLAVADAPFGAP